MTDRTLYEGGFTRCQYLSCRSTRTGQYFCNAHRVGWDGSEISYDRPLSAEEQQELEQALKEERCLTSVR